MYKGWVGGFEYVVSSIPSNISKVGRFQSGWNDLSLVSAELDIQKYTL